MTFFAIMKITNAITIKLINSPKKEPHPMNIGPKVNVAVFHAPPGIKGVITGMIMLSTKDFTNAVAAIPIIKAIAKAITLYSRKNSINSFIILIIIITFHILGVKDI